jgi:hypothetical protein
MMIIPLFVKMSIHDNILYDDDAMNGVAGMMKVIIVMR